MTLHPKLRFNPMVLPLHLNLNTKVQYHIRTCKGRRRRTKLQISEPQRLAFCRRTHAVKSDQPAKHFSPSPSTPFYLNELLSAVELWHQNVLPVSQSCEGHAQLSRGPKVGVHRKLLQQGVLYCPQQTEGRVENSQSVFSGLFRCVQNINTELFWGGKCGKISLWR